MTRPWSSYHFAAACGPLARHRHPSGLPLARCVALDCDATDAQALALAVERVWANLGIADRRALLRLWRTESFAACGVTFQVAPAIFTTCTAWGDEEGEPSPKVLGVCSRIGYRITIRRDVLRSEVADAVLAHELLHALYAALGFPDGREDNDDANDPFSNEHMWIYEAMWHLGYDEDAVDAWFTGAAA
jgi:hypothetical protein